MNKDSHSIFINSMGMINALGLNNQQIFNNLKLSVQENVVLDDHLTADRSVYVARVSGELPAVDKLLGAFLNSRNNRLLQASIRQIEHEVRSLIEDVGKDRIAVVMGTSTSGILETENALEFLKEHSDFPQNYHYCQQEMGAPAEFISRYFDLNNLAISVSTACSSSAKVFSTARDLILSGFCDAAIVGGADSLCRMTVNGFSSLESVSDGICNPFSVHRDGITIGEGAAVFILSAKPGPVKVSGIGESSDAYHISAPEPNGEGAERSIRAALKDANMSACDICYINLHGTATIKNDHMEAAVVNRIFGSDVYCSSTKPMTGHTLGAAGAVEIGICCLLLTATEDLITLPVNLWDGQADPALPSINLVKENTQIAQDICQKMMTNSFAFGGSNASIILEKMTNITE